MVNNEDLKDPEKEKSESDKKQDISLTEKEEKELVPDEPVYTENDIVSIDNAEYHTNFTNKYLATRGYKPKTKNVEIRAFIPGQIVKVYTKKGKKVKAGKLLITFEAMKMINEIVLHDDILIEDVFVKAGESVEKNQLLIKYKIRPHK